MKNSLLLSIAALAISCSSFILSIIERQELLNGKSVMYSEKVEKRTSSAVKFIDAKDNHKECYTGSEIIEDEDGEINEIPLTEEKAQEMFFELEKRYNQQEVLK